MVIIVMSTVSIMLYNNCHKLWVQVGFLWMVLWSKTYLKLLTCYSWDMLSMPVALSCCSSCTNPTALVSRNHTCLS